MKEVLVLLGSPRKGNSLAAARRVEKTLVERDFRVEYVFLSEMGIEACRGCFACLRTGIENCPLKDDVPAILEIMARADGIIFVSPVYVMGVSGLMKNFFDRLSSICHRPSFCGKYAMALSTVGAVGLKDTLRYMAGAVGSWQFRKVVKLGLRTPHAMDIERNMTPGNLRKIRKRALRFGNMILDGSYASPNLAQVLQFRFQRAVFTGGTSEEWPADSEFYSALAGRDYYCDVRVNPLLNLVGAVAEKLAGWSMSLRKRGEETADA